MVKYYKIIPLKGTKGHSSKAFFLLQKGWPYKRGTIVFFINILIIQVII
jgi:hypothetical protein